MKLIFKYLNSILLKRTFDIRISKVLKNYLLTIKDL